MSDSKPPTGSVGERIRGLLRERQMSQRQLAAAMAGDGASSSSVENVRRQISSWVNDQHVPSPENTEALAAQLGVSVELLTVAAPRRNLAAALEDLADAVGLLTEWADAQAARSEEAVQLVQALDLRLEHNEALLRQLLEGQLTAAGALEGILERLDADESGSQDPRRQTGHES